MEILSEDIQNVKVIRIVGDLDYQNYRDLKNKVDDLIQSGTPMLLIDLKDTASIDSMGVGSITSLWKLAREKNATLCLSSPRPNVEKLIRLINIDQRIKVYTTTDDALTELSTN